MLNHVAVAGELRSSVVPLLGLAVRAVAATPRAILVELQAIGIVAPILARRVIAPLALVARQVNHQAILFRCFSHAFLLVVSGE